MNERLRIAIIGCGIGGQAAALFCVRDGHDVELFESFERPKQLGAGLLIQPTGQAALEALGLLEPAVACGARVNRLIGHNLTRRLVMDLSYQDYKSDWFGLGIQRAALFELLLGAIKSETVNLRFGVTIEEITNSPRRRVIDANGRTYGPYDLVIAADGANSSLRTRSGLDLRAPLYPWGAVWALCPDPESAFSNQLQQVYDRASIMIGISPVGRMPDETAGPPLVTFFWSLRRKDLFKFQNQAVDVWKSEVRGYWPEAALLLESIENIGDLAPATYRDVVMRRWIDRGLVFIGDAAHGMSPQLGQGANLALVDAWVLAACLRDNSCDLSGALESYQQIRLSHTGFYQFASRWLTPVFQSNSRAIATARDFLMGPACKMPILGNEMLKTLVGVRQGLWDTWAAPVMDQRVDE